MALSRMWIIAFRDLGRNRRRSILSLLAVGLGLALVIILNGLVAGVFDESLESSIKLQTGHVQIRAESYQEEKNSLKWKDLVADPEILAQQALGMDGVIAATPVLRTSAILNTSDESVGLMLSGIDPTSAYYAPVQQALVAGTFLTPDDRNGVLLGKRLANSLDLAVDDKITLTVINADDEPDEGTFVIRGLFETGVLNYDESAVLMPLAKAQAFTRTEGHASAIVVLLRDRKLAPQVAAALQAPGLTTLTWEELNAVMLNLVQTGMAFYVILDGIVMLVVAVIIANTLLMAVFERIREMGILAALGMKARQILLMYLLEAAALGLIGILVGIVIGAAGVAYLGATGIPIGEIGASTPGFAMGSVMRARFVPSQFLSFSFWTLVITLLASMYPAWFAARLEPVDALRAV